MYKRQALDADGQTIATGPPAEAFGVHGEALAAAGIRLPTAVRLHHLLAGRGLTAASADRESAFPLTLDDAAQELAAAPSALCAGPARPTPAEDPAPRGGADGTARNEEPVLVARDLSVPRGRGRRRHEVLHGVHLALRRGEVLAVVGINGSGKSTLLRALAGLEAWTTGEVTVAGRPRRPGRPGRAVTLVMQNPEHQFLEPTVRDELAHGMRLEGAEEARVDRAVDEMLARFDLVDRADANPFLLSGGQQRRLSVASVLGEHRKVVCLDEPTFGQDRRGAEALMGRLRDVAAQGAGLVITTHDMELAADHADRVLILAGGTVLSEGPAREVLADAPLLARAGLRPPPLARLTRAAADLGAATPTRVSWKELA